MSHGIIILWLHFFFCHLHSWNKGAIILTVFSLNQLKRSNALRLFILLFLCYFLSVFSYHSVYTHTQRDIMTSFFFNYDFVKSFVSFVLWFDWVVVVLLSFSTHNYNIFLFIKSIFSPFFSCNKSVYIFRIVICCLHFFLLVI